MKKFFINIILFFILSLIIGESIVRYMHLVSDIPQREIDTHGIQKYIPYQNGYWKNGKHKWKINKLGWAGDLPDTYTNLIAIIGDSYIENLMNPNECHQSIFLKKNMRNYNFIEAGRSGVTFIEAMEIAKQFDTLKPIKNLIYLKDDDFYESIAEVKKLKDVTQLSLKSKTILFGEMKGPLLKKILYNFKLLYYFYNRFPSFKLTKNEIKVNKTVKGNIEHKNKIFELLNFIKTNYDIKNKILVFHPKSNKTIIEMCKAIGFNIIILNSKDDDRDWSFDYDSHWTCYGHEKVAKQVSKKLLNTYLNK